MSGLPSSDYSQHECHTKSICFLGEVLLFYVYNPPFLWSLLQNHDHRQKHINCLNHRSQLLTLSAPVSWFPLLQSSNRRPAQFSLCNLSFNISAYENRVPTGTSPVNVSLATTGVLAVEPTWVEQYNLAIASCYHTRHGFSDSACVNIQAGN